MRFRRLAESVVVMGLPGTTAQADIAHAAFEDSLHHARGLDAAVGANLALASLSRQGEACGFGDSMVSDGAGLVNPWPPTSGLNGHVDTPRDNRSDATCPRR